MDPYVYPGTSVLKNLRDIRDPDRLSKFEMDMTTRRFAELARTPTPTQLDAGHLQAIHRYIFQDVYAWAGEFRTVNISRSGQFPFGFSHLIHQCLSKLFGDLEAEHNLANLERTMFADRAAYYLGELNAIHPFRDGNGRAQRELIRQLACLNGYEIDWSRVSRDQMVQASQASFQGADNSGLAKLLLGALRND
jgi:cell filamentation protein